MRIVRLLLVWPLRLARLRRGHLVQALFHKVIIGRFRHLYCSNALGSGVPRIKMGVVSNKQGAPKPATQPVGNVGRRATMASTKPDQEADEILKDVLPHCVTAAALGSNVFGQSIDGLRLDRALTDPNRPASNELCCVETLSNRSARVWTPMDAERNCIPCEMPCPLY